MKIRFASLVLLVLLLFPAAAIASDTPPREDDNWWTTRYLVDYGVIAAGAAGYLVLGQVEPNPDALVGPSFDPEDPTEILDGPFNDRLGRRHADDEERRIGETVPEDSMILAIGGVAGLLALEEGLYWALSEHGSARRFHDTLVGFAEMVALTAATTEVTKVLVGRLRPDFQDRVRRYLCQTDPDTEIECGGVRDLAPSDEEAEEILLDGRKSFFSGHSSFGLAVATYTSLVIGGRWVWSDEATALSRPLGIFLQTATMATGLFAAGSRIDDGRHHMTDVLVGATVGFGLANLAYWRRFGGDGHPIQWGRRDAPVAHLRLVPGPANGLSIVVTH